MTAAYVDIEFESVDTHGFLWRRMAIIVPFYSYFIFLGVVKPLHQSLDHAQ